MARYIIFLLALWVASANGVIIPVGVLVTTIIIMFIVAIGLTVKQVKENMNAKGI